MAHEYGASAIRVLSDGEHLRLRPAMYVGSTDADGVYQIVKEVIDNALDEFLAGHAKHISVTVTDRTITVADDGRGIPIEIHEATSISTLTTVLTNLQAGGKFDQAAYKVSAGLHGVGIKATNYLSVNLVARVVRDERPKGARKPVLRSYEQRFQRGVPDGPVRPTEEPATHTGTTIEFTPDPEIFGDAVLDVDRLKRSLRDASALCRGLVLNLTHQGQSFVYRDTGLIEVLDADVQQPRFEHRGDNMDVVIVWSDREADEDLRGFVNLTPTPGGGTHIQGLRDTLRQVLGGLPGAQNLQARDLMSGIKACLHVLVSNPSFHGQTKDRLLNKETSADVQTTLRPLLQRWLDQNKAVGRQIVERAVRLGKEREAIRKLKSATQSTVVARRDARGVLPGKLVEAVGCKPADRELYICEGNSAAGSAVAARDPKRQEVLPLRGKIVNAQRVDATAVLRNEEVQSLIVAIGLQINPNSHEADLSKMRVGRVLLLCDADPDGLHITTLVLGFFYRFARNLIDAGHVYIVRSPLFRGTDGTDYWYADSLADLEKLAGRPASKLQVSRLKGHGEADAREIGYYAMRGTRRLIRVTSQDQENRFDALMGDDSSARKELLGLG